jgi:hypothetical protein
MSQVMQSVEPQGREAELEMELGAEELLELSRRPAPRHTATAPALAAELPTRHRRRLSRIQIGAGAATLVAVLVGLALDRSPGTEQPARAAPIPPPIAALTPAPAAPIAAPVPVKFANPFDRSEVFEFPAGTSKSEARARVADLLMKRAQERRAQYKRVAPHHTRVASR